MKFTATAYLRVPGKGFPEVGTTINIKLDVPGDHATRAEAREAARQVIYGLNLPELFEDPSNRPTIDVA